MLDLILVVIAAPFVLFAVAFCATVGWLVLSALGSATLEALGVRS